MAGSTTFGFACMDHFFASAFHDLQKALQFVERVGAKVQSEEGTVEAITALLPNGNTAVVLERAAFAALGLVLNAANAASAAAAQDGVNVKLDAEMVAAFRGLIAGAKGELEALGYKL
jgi:hypothetical protein